MTLRGVTANGLELPTPERAAWAPALTTLDADTLTSWGATAVTIPIAQDLALLGHAQLTGEDYLATLDETIITATSAGLYPIVQLSLVSASTPTSASDAGDVYEPAVPDPASIDLWAILARRYASEPAVLFDLFAHPNHPAPSDSTAFLVGSLGWDIWRRWLLAMLGEIRRNHPAALVVARAPRGDLSGFPLRYTDGTEPANVLYAVRLRTTELRDRLGEVVAFSRERAVVVSALEADAQEGPGVQALGARLARTGLHWIAGAWSRGRAALVDPRPRELRPTRLGRAVHQALAQPTATETHLDPALRAQAFRLPTWSLASATAAMPAPAPLTPSGPDRYGGYDLRRGDRDSGLLYGGAARSAAAGDRVPGAGEMPFVERLQRDLADLGFALAGAPDGSFGPMVEWAVREFQIYATMPFVAREADPAPGAPTRYVDRLTQAPNPVVDQYTGTVSGVVNAATRARLARWLHNRWRCPVVVEAWTMRGNTRTSLVAQNIWRHDAGAGAQVRVFARDFSGRYSFPAGRQASDLVVLGHHASYRQWEGPVSLAPRETWTPEGEMLPQSLTGAALADMGPATRSTYKVVRAVAEVECMAFFDTINAYDNAFISLGPCHWTLGIATAGVVHDGELPGFLAYLRAVEPATFADTVEVFGLRPSRNWLDASGAATGQPLFRKAQRKYTAWLEVQRDDGSYAPATTVEAEANFLKTWHWFYRWLMAARTVAPFRRRMWDMARIRLRDVMAAPFGAGVPDVSDGAGGTRPATIGDVFTSERAVALILRWHIRFPGHVIANGRAAQHLRSAFARSHVGVATDPGQWGDAEETLLIDAIMTEVRAVANAGLTTTMTQVQNWPSWATASNPRQYTLSPAIGAHSTARGSFQLDMAGLPPAPSYT